MEMAIIMAKEFQMDWILHLNTDELIHLACAHEYSVRQLLSEELVVKLREITSLKCQRDEVPTQEELIQSRSPVAPVEKQRSATPKSVSPPGRADSRSLSPQCSDADFMGSFRWSHGSFVHRYSLYTLQWIVEVNGKPTPNLEAFVNVTKEIEDGEYTSTGSQSLDFKFEKNAPSSKVLEGAIVIVGGA
ncbi:hypothetical protein Tco_0386930, partial [Tanacetum coccineum]